MKPYPFYTIIIFFFISVLTSAQENNPSVFHSNRGEAKWLLFKNNNQALYKIITNEAFQLLEERSENIAGLKTTEAWKAYQQNLRSKIFSSLGKFEKSPLNAKVTGKIERETFTVEKILFESHPDFFVTGCLFIPKHLRKPAPAVIYCSGHNELAFRCETYQHIILNLVEKGFIVFGLDPIGQGERLQYLNVETGKSEIGGPTKEHTFTGVQTLLAGTSLSDYFIWDGVRTVDFLLSREEIDPKRIGITGRSGGGTQSAMIAAYDERIYAAAPECYITNFKRLLQSIGPQDAEQNLFNAIKLGFDHPDYLHLRSPLPALIVTTTNDFFSQQGARESFAEAKRSYNSFGKPANIEMVEDYGKHESTKNNREALYAFFQKHLELPGDNSDHDVALFKPEELWVTATGQLQSSNIGETIFNLNKRYFSKKELSKSQIKEKAIELAGISFDRKFTAAVYTGKYLSTDFAVEKYFIENSKNDFALPVYVSHKEGSEPDKIVVWLHPEGKKSILENENAKKLMDAGFLIVSCDLPGIGELYDPGFSGDGFVKGVPFNYTFGAHLIGKTIPGIQAESIDLLMQFVEREYKQNKIYAWIEGELNSAFLHFAVQENPFSKIVFSKSTNSNMDLIMTEFYDLRRAYSVVPGSLPYYDLEDLKSFIPAKMYKNFNPGDNVNSILNFLND